MRILNFEFQRKRFQVTHRAPDFYKFIIRWRIKPKTVSCIRKTVYSRSETRKPCWKISRNQNSAEVLDSRIRASFQRKYSYRGAPGTDCRQLQSGLQATITAFLQYLTVHVKFLTFEHSSNNKNRRINFIQVLDSRITYPSKFWRIFSGYSRTLMAQH